MVATAIFIPQFYLVLFNPDPLWGYSDTPVGSVLLFIVPISMLIALSIAAICYVVNKMKARKK